MSQSTLDYILSRLDGVKTAGADQWMACCPAHDDFSPSLSVADSEGNVLLHCHAGCDVREVCEALGLRLRDLFGASAQPHQTDAAYARQMAERIQRREAQRAAKYDVTAKRARELWRQSQPADLKHPYLIDKCVQSFGLRQRGYHLLVPIVYRGLLVNLQRIAGNGGKLFLKEGRIRGCYSPIGKIEPGIPLILCEGWATGATLYEKYGCAIACAMNSGNLFSAGDELLRAHPDIELIIAGDDDRDDPKNPGRRAAEKAAQLLDCNVIFPDWPTDCPANLSDFNDLAKWSFENVGYNTFCG